MVPAIVTNWPSLPDVGEKLRFTGGPLSVTVSPSEAGRRPGAEAFTVREPMTAPLATTEALVPLGGIVTLLAIVTCPAPVCVKVTSRPLGPAGAADVTVRVTAVPTGIVVAVAESESAGGVWTVSVVSPETGPMDVVTVARMVVVPTARAEANPVLLIEATVVLVESQVTSLPSV